MKGLKYRIFALGVIARALFARSNLCDKRDCFVAKNTPRNDTEPNAKCFKRNNRAVSTMEYLFFMTLVLFAILGLQKYMAHGMYGMWKRTGDSFGFGRQYDPNTTIECAFDLSINRWYDVFCLESIGCAAGDNSCRQSAINGQCDVADCNK